MAKLLGFVADRTSVGRMIKHDENFGEAWLNAGKQSLKDLKSASLFVADRTSVGRMIVHDEDFGEAWLNAGKQSLKDIGLID